ncbi:MAG TPA: hypothetical protein VKR56_14040 [Candidatus Cybelea sp.]|nr:hypothetical protein [Candidatus Cybelea sp.]
MPCAPFTSAGIHIVRVIPNSAFGKGTKPVDIAVLSDGTVLVQTADDGLYRIVNGRVAMVWGPNPRCGPRAHFLFSFAQPFDNELLLNLIGLKQIDHESLFNPYSSGVAAVRADGSLAFRLPPSSSSIESVEQDASGTVWLLYGRLPNQALYAYSPRIRTSVLVQTPSDVYKMFRAPDGHVYASNFHGLFELDSHPAVRVRFVHAPIEGQPVQAVGRDGSLWASTPTQVIHAHPHGAIRVMLPPQGRAA